MVSEGDKKAQFCPACGQKVVGAGVFCINCGCNLKQASESVEADTAQVIEPRPPIAKAATEGDTQLVGSDANGTAQSAVADVVPQKPKGKLSKGAIGAIVAAVVVIAVAIGAFVFMDMQKKAHDQELYDLAHQTYVVAMSMEVPGWDEAASTPIPMQVDGTDFEGNAVHRAFLYGAGQEPLMLMRGNYTVTVVTGPINQDGGIYTPPGEGQEVTVVDDEVEEMLEEEGRGEWMFDGHSGLVDMPGVVYPPSFSFQPVSPIDVTDDMLEAIKQALLDAGWPAADVDAFVQKAAEAHQAAVKAEEERKAAERAAKKAEFQARLDSLNATPPNISDYKSGPEFSEAYQAYFGKYKSLLREVSASLSSYMPQDEAASFQAQQDSYSQSTESSIKDKYMNVDARNVPSASTMAASMYTEMSKSFSPHIQELINMF